MEQRIVLTTAVLLVTLAVAFPPAHSLETDVVMAALFALAGVSLLVTLIGLRYWFSVPRLGSLVATLCLFAAALLYALPGLLRY